MSTNLKLDKNTFYSYLSEKKSFSECVFVIKKMDGGWVSGQGRRIKGERGRLRFKTYLRHSVASLQMTL